MIQTIEISPDDTLGPFWCKKHLCGAMILLFTTETIR